MSRVEPLEYKETGIDALMTALKESAGEIEGSLDEIEDPDDIEAEIEEIEGKLNGYRTKLERLEGLKAQIETLQRPSDEEGEEGAEPAAAS